MSGEPDRRSTLRAGPPRPTLGGSTPTRRGRAWPTISTTTGTYRSSCDRDRGTTRSISIRHCPPSSGCAPARPESAFTAQTLGTERAGNGVLIRDDGIVLTIGYLVTEAQSVWLKTNTGRTVPGHVLGIDQASGLGVVQALEPLDVPALELGDLRHAGPGSSVVMGAHGGRRRSLAAQIVARQEFAGYWEYLIEEAIFTAPAHPNWGGTALIGVGRQAARASARCSCSSRPRSGRIRPLNMVVPVELLVPGAGQSVWQAAQPVRRGPGSASMRRSTRTPCVILDIAQDGPARRSGLKRGDIVRNAGGMEITNLADFYRSVWASGPAGAEVALDHRSRRRRVRSSRVVLGGSTRLPADAAPALSWRLPLRMARASRSWRGFDQAEHTPHPK